MIHEFAVENFLSFKKEQVLSFEASSDKTYEDFYIVNKGSYRLLKLCIIYGANGSGKTNLLASLETLRNISTDTREDKNEDIPITPFLLDVESRKKPTKFYISFFVNDTRYVYSISLTSKSILEERLVFYPKTQPATVYHRFYDS